MREVTQAPRKAVKSKQPRVKAPRRRPRLEGHQLSMHLATRPGTHTCWVCGTHDRVRLLRQTVRSGAGLVTAGGLLFGAAGAAGMSLLQTEGAVCLPVCPPCQGRWKLAGYGMPALPLLLLALVVASIAVVKPHPPGLALAIGGLAWAAGSAVGWFVMARFRFPITLRDQVATVRLPRPEVVAEALARDEELAAES